MKLKNPLSEPEFYSLLNVGLQFDWLKTCEEGLIELWKSAKDDVNQKRLILYLIHQFLYVDSEKADEYCKMIVRQITEEWGLKSRNTIITAACDNSAPDGSQLIIQKLKNRFPFSWREFDFMNSLPEAAYKLSSNDNLVICDDFIGTGLTMQHKIGYVRRVIGTRWLENVQIYVVSFAAMRFSKDNVWDWLYPQFACEWLPKGISDTLTGDRLSTAVKIMEQMESVLKPTVGNRRLPKFGYKHSESLYNYENDNIPNNVFPIFWWQKYKNNQWRLPMFRRV